jgi:hypothetical protein
MYEALNQTAPNWTMRSQNTACIAKSSCQICGLLRYYATYTSNSLPTFQDNLYVPASRVKKYKNKRRELDGS